MNILVTGGAGFIGSWLVESLASAGHSLTVLDNLSPQVHGGTSEEAIRRSLCAHPKTQLIVGNACDEVLLDGLLKEAEAVVHLAAETGTGQSMYQIAHYVDVNIGATAKLFELIGTRHRHVKKVVLASSRSVYGEGAYLLNGKMISPPSRTPEQLARGEWDPVGPTGEALRLIPTPEDCPLNPASIYASSKSAMEDIGRICAQAYRLPVFALRFQNVYGERQSLVNPYTGILSIFSNRMRRDRPINVFEDGLESRDFVHVSDVVRAIGLSLTTPLDGYRVLNVGSGVATSVLDIAQRLSRILGSNSAIQVSGDYRAGDIRHCFADTRAARDVLGFEARMSLDDGLAAFCRWLTTQPVQQDRSREVLRELADLGLGRTSP